MAKYTVDELYEATNTDEYGWDMEDGTGDQFDRPIKAKLEDGEPCKKQIEFRGLIGGTGFKSDNKKVSLKMDIGIRGINIPAVAVQCTDGWVVFH